MNANFSESLNVRIIDEVLTEAYHMYYNKLVEYVEVDSKFRNLLRQMEDKNYSCEISLHDSKRFYLAKFPKDYYSRLRAVCLAEKSGCGEKELIVRFIKSDNLSEALKDPYWKPSFEFEETLGDEFRDGMAVYFDDFTIKNMYLDYLIKPDNLCAPSLMKEGFYINGSNERVEIDKDLPLTSTVQANHIADIAALIIARDKGDTLDYQTQLNKIMSIENMRLT